MSGNILTPVFKFLHYDWDNADRRGIPKTMTVKYSNGVKATYKIERREWVMFTLSVPIFSSNGTETIYRPIIEGNYYSAVICKKSKSVFALKEHTEQGE